MFLPLLPTNLSSSEVKSQDANKLMQIWKDLLQGFEMLRQTIEVVFQIQSIMTQ